MNQDELYSKWAEFLEKPGRFLKEDVDAAFKMFNEASFYMGYEPPIPATETHNGGIFMSWDAGHLVLNMIVDGGWDWFFKNRLTGEVDGSDDLEPWVPSEFYKRLKQVSDKAKEL